MVETYLSQDAFDRLTAELDDLKTNGRRDIADEIEEARAHGDLKENAEYHAAKDKQGHMEGRIRQLEVLLRDATVGGPTGTDRVAAGLVVTLKIEGDEEIYLVGSREDAHDELEILSVDSPLGQAVLGARVGQEVHADAPGGKYAVEVASITLP